MSATADAAIEFWDEGRVGVLRLGLGGGDKLTPEVLCDLRAGMEVFEAREGRVLLLCSARPGAFASGGDVEYLGKLDSTDFVAYMQAMRGVLEQLDQLGAPTVAAIDGAALGAGLELALACTLRIAGPASHFGLPQVKLGLIPAAGGTQRLPRLVGHGRALELMVTGRTVDAQEAFRIGLIDRLAPAGAVEAVALELARDIASVSWAAVTAVRRAAAAAERPFPQGMAVEAREALALFERGGVRQDFGPFVEKRPPRFA